MKDLFQKSKSYKKVIRRLDAFPFLFYNELFFIKIKQKRSSLSF